MSVTLVADIVVSGKRKQSQFGVKGVIWWLANVMLSKDRLENDNSCFVGQLTLASKRTLLLVGQVIGSITLTLSFDPHLPSRK